MSNLIKAIAANYAISTVATLAIFGPRPDALNTTLYLMSNDESDRRKGRKYMYQNLALSSGVLALQIAANKAITGHYIRIWK